MLIIVDIQDFVIDVEIDIVEIANIDEKTMSFDLIFISSCVAAAISI